MVDSVEAYLHEHEEAPVLRPRKMVESLEVILGHLADLFDEAFLVLDAELDIYLVIFDCVLDLIAEFRGVCVLPVCVRGDEAPD